MRMIIRVVSLTLMLSLAQGMAAAPTDKAFLWKVEAPKATLYLMGSLHFATADFYPLRADVEQAFTASQQLVVEVDVAAVDPLQLQQMILETGTYSGDELLEDHLSPATWQRLAAYMESKGLPLASFSRYRPGLLITTLTSLEIMEEGLSADSGIDLYFLNQARGEKKVIELESLQQQLALLLDMDNPDQVMVQSLDEFDHYDVMVAQLVDIWRRGDVQELEQMLITEPLQQYPESRPYFDRVFTQRNLAMAESLAALTDQGSSYFVVVGAGHLIGENGLVQLMQQAGYKVTRQ